MAEVVPIKGLTKFTIILDPSVWIFDKRKILLDAFLQTGERIEVEERETHGSYGIPFKPFLLNAEPLPEANTLTCHQADGQAVSIPLEDAYHAILAFAHEGKPIKDKGPLHLYIGKSGTPALPSTVEPITQIISFELTRS